MKLKDLTLDAISSPNAWLVVYNNALAAGRGRPTTAYTVSRQGERSLVGRYNRLLLVSGRVEVSHEAKV